MTTAYTSLLGLALPVTGELQGTWGDVVNNSITSLLDTAVAGTTTLGTDADVTLTTTTGASNQARQAILLCSGARTGIRNITAPATSKAYIVINATTGGYAVVVRGAGPTTGVTISNGEKCLIAWNGSDFVKASSTISNAGGSNTQVQYNSGGVLAGNSNFVFDGTNVGIGTASPASKLEVTSSALNIVSSKSTGNYAAFLANAATGNQAYVFFQVNSAETARIASDAGNVLAFSTGNTGSERMRIDASGNVGIGTASPAQLVEASLSQNGKTQVKVTNVNAGASASAGVLFGTSSGENGYIGANGGAASSALGGANAVQVANLTANPLVLATNATERMRIDSSGNVGVVAGGKLLVGATTTALTPGIQVYGPDGSANISAKRYSNNTTGVTIQGVKTRGTSPTDLTTVVAGDNLVSFVGSATQGTGTVPVVALDISVDPNGTVSATSVPGVFTVGIVPNGSLGVGVERLRIDMNGNMGLGTNNPLARFDISGNQASNIVTVAALDIDCSQGNYFIKTINGASTFTFSNPPAGRAYAFTLELTQTSGAVTWPASVKWPNNTAPTLTAGNTQLFTFITDDGGARWRGSSLVNYPN